MIILQLSGYDIHCWIYVGLCVYAWMQSPTVLKTDVNVNVHAIRTVMKFCIYFNADLAISNCQFVKINK